MDMLDPLDNSGSNDHDEKVILNSGLNIDDHSMGSEDDPHIDHLSPQTLLETPQEDLQYSLRTAEGTVTYGVFKVEDENVPQILTGTGFANSGVQQVLTGNLNGQLYVIGGPNDVFVSNPTGTSRAIAPRSQIVEGTAVTGVTSIKRRDERRRATHNEVERRRRDKINNWITKLSKIIPENVTPDMKGNGHYDGQSKGGILAKACEYILELRECQEKLETFSKEHRQLSESVETLKHKNVVLERENRALRDILKHNGIEVKDASS